MSKSLTSNGLWMVPRDRDIAAQQEEEVWARRVEAARFKYNSAKSQLRQAIAGQKKWPLQESHGSALFEVARLRVAAERSEYVRVLKIFTELLMSGEDQETKSKSG